MKAEAEHYRRLLSESGAYTRGTLYWQLVGGLGTRVCTVLYGLADMEEGLINVFLINGLINAMKC